MAGRRRSVAALAAVLVAAPGCASNGLASLPLPHPGLGKGGYSITAVFENALNLPAFAKVRLAGADVGQLEAIAAREGFTVPKFVSTLHNEILIMRGEAPNFTSHLRCVCLVAIENGLQTPSTEPRAKAA